jgi:hypothetical protein
MHKYVDIYLFILLHINYYMFLYNYCIFFGLVFTLPSPPGPPDSPVLHSVPLAVVDTTFAHLALYAILAALAWWGGSLGYFLLLW